MAEGIYFEHIDTRSRQIDIVGQGQENTIIDGMELGRPVKITACLFFRIYNSEWKRNRPSGGSWRGNAY